ncbi:integrase catalytic domain-containing protein [Trichonephila inaurata madagascariensis]|uniref:Integrase catalytic domain-containing protein n=1 Tax=Trichonephila inaurata madagascariensis TaxID=2747483 RepID=A0A8X6XGR8_9ARAC|nr:integrase catalytic domain-containing protein [Trichonephila inaurata madagascariensis]
MDPILKGSSSHREKARGVVSARKEIEACLNSRPLTELSPDPSDFNALTPARFLVGGPIHQFPEPSQPSRSVALSERWNLILRLRRYFWYRWSLRYLHGRKPGSKVVGANKSSVRNMVIIEEQTAPLNWTLGELINYFSDLTKGTCCVSVNTKYGLN